MNKLKISLEDVLEKKGVVKFKKLFLGTPGPGWIDICFVVVGDKEIRHFLEQKPCGFCNVASVPNPTFDFEWQFLK